MSSWYVWAAIGMYPETPGTANLALASPLFPSVVITLGNGRKIGIDAPAASPANRYIQSLRITGMQAPATCEPAAYQCPWLPASIITSGAQLHFTLSATPNRSWGTAASAEPPSISPQQQ
jgi:putative alpha-1,2-mannosidase